MKISQPQRAILERLKCERLSSNPDNLYLVDSFLFLFAADLSEEDSLIGYYRDKLDFMRDEERATVKPIYDLSCEFMYQETKDLEERRKQFFNHFNLETEEI